MFVAIRCHELISIYTLSAEHEQSVIFQARSIPSRKIYPHNIIMIAADSLARQSKNLQPKDCSIKDGQHTVYPNSKLTPHFTAFPVKVVTNFESMELGYLVAI